MAVLALAGCNKDNQTSGGDRRQRRSRSRRLTRRPAATWADVTNATSGRRLHDGQPQCQGEAGRISGRCPARTASAVRREGMPTLVNKYVKSGKVSWEFRPYVIHGPIDMAANLSRAATARRRFFPLVGRCTRIRPPWSGRSKRRRRISWRRFRTCRPSRSSFSAPACGLAGLGRRARRSAGQDQPVPGRSEDDQPARSS